MHLGIYIQNPPQELGGGYTFEEQILRELVRCPDKRGNRFTILAKYDAPKDLSLGTDVAALSLSDAIHGTKRPFTERARGRAVRLLRGTPTHSDAMDPGKLQAQTQCLRDLGIDFVLSLVPWEVPSLDIPYASLVWDFMHRSHPYFPEVSQGNVWEAREKLFSVVLRRAAYVITGTRAGRQEIEHYYQVPAERIRLLPHPTPEYALRPGRINEQLLEKFKLPQPFLLYPAQLWPHKNHVNLCLALGLLRSQRGLVIPTALSGADLGNREFLQTVAERAGVADQLRFLGFVSRDELLALYQGALALTYVSFCGPENLPPLEAFALGCPVLAARIPGAEEQLGDAALFVDPKSPQSIADGIFALHDDAQLRRKLITRGKERAHRFTVSDFVHRTLDIVDEFSSVRRAWGRG